MSDTHPGAQEPHHHHHLNTAEWQRIAGEAPFRHLVSVKRRFIIPATIFFIVYYFCLPVLVGYFPETMSRKVWGNVSAAYLFALSQFVMAWVIMALYLRRARYFDKLESEIAQNVRGEFK